MRQSNLFNQTLKKASQEATIVSHQLLIRAGYIAQVSSGIWEFLPLGFRVQKKIEGLVREEMNKIGGQEILLPVLQPKELWLETNRWETIDPPLFKLFDRHRKELALGSTHEEIISDLVRRHNLSYKQLPLALYQIQNKFRNEQRSSGGLLRTREFIMKDLYSFHIDSKDLDEYYQKVLKAYQNLMKRIGLKATMVQASGGTIGGTSSEEITIEAEVGEDKIAVCRQGHFAANLELFGKDKNCPKCREELTVKNGIEAGHLFKLGDLYSKKMKVFYTDKDGSQKPVLMGCYGLGLGRLMAIVVEKSFDQNGIIWPAALSPFQVHLLDFGQTPKVSRQALELYLSLQKMGYEVLYDDRKLSPGVKLKDSDLLGISVRLIVSNQTKDKIEYKERQQAESCLLNLKQVVKKLQNIYD